MIILTLIFPWQSYEYHLSLPVFMELCCQHAATPQQYTKMRKNLADVTPILSPVLGKAFPLKWSGGCILHDTENVK